MNVQRLEAQLWAGSDRAVMPCVPATACDQVVVTRHRVAADARQMSVTQADVLVHRSLRLAQVIRPALQPLLAHLNLATLNLRQRLACLLLIHILDGQTALWAAHGLTQALRREADAASWVFARLRSRLFGCQTHWYTLPGWPGSLLSVQARL
ncbi:hypothetical protein D9M71_585760 [compost metagenome]